MLVTSAYTPDIDAHEFRNQVTNEVTGTGYTAGGQTVANKTVVQSNSNDRAIFDFDDVTWANSTITARGAVLYRDTGTPATSELIAYWDFATDRISSNGNFTVQISANGALVAQ
jgi:hypothetical protein